MRARWIAGVAAVALCLGAVPVLAAGASITVAVGSKRVTVSGNAGGTIGNYAQVLFDAKACAATYEKESARGTTSGTVISPQDGGAFKESWSIHGLTEGPPPIQRHVCAYVIGRNNQGTLVALASATASLPVHK